MSDDSSCTLLKRGEARIRLAQFASSLLTTKGDLEERRRPFGLRDVGAAVFMRLQQ